MSSSLGETQIKLHFWLFEGLKENPNRHGSQAKPSQG